MANFQPITHGKSETELPNSMISLRKTQVRIADLLFSTYYHFAYNATQRNSNYCNILLLFVTLFNFLVLSFHFIDKLNVIYSKGILNFD